LKKSSTPTVAFLGDFFAPFAKQNQKMARKSSKAKILEKQSTNKKKTNEIAAIVQQLRLKPDWISKISDPTLKAKYREEALGQGISDENFQKAFSILETMAQCQPQRSRLSSSSSSSSSQESIDVIVRIGETAISTTTKILTADSESMLSRMFSSSWLNESHKTEPIHIETTSNSPQIFSLILSYLTALSQHNNSDLCPDLGIISFEEIDSLLADCDYLGLRRLAIAVSVQLMSTEMTIAEDQKKFAERLAQVSQRLRMVREEKIRIEKRLAELPALIQQLEEDEAQAEQERLRPMTRMRLQAGDSVMINTSGRVWQPCTLIHAEEAEVGEQKTKKKKSKTETKSSSSPSPGQHEGRRELLAMPTWYGSQTAIPLPGRAFYHPVSLLPEQHFHSSIFSYDNFLPEPLSQSLEEHLDGLLHQKALDLHPGSDGQVVDLIHPSLFPFIKGVTKVSDPSELADCAPIDNGANYSWLPAEFAIDESGKVTIESYINNLDQETYPELYFDISQIFQAILPMFETTFSTKFRSCTLQVIVKAAYYFIPPGETYEGQHLILASPLAFLSLLLLTVRQDRGMWRVCLMRISSPVQSIISPRVTISATTTSSSALYSQRRTSMILMAVLVKRWA
jgi:hypothetical protein